MDMPARADPSTGAESVGEMHASLIRAQEGKAVHGGRGQDEELLGALLESETGLVAGVLPWQRFVGYAADEGATQVDPAVREAEVTARVSCPVRRGPPAVGSPTFAQQADPGAFAQRKCHPAA